MGEEIKDKNVVKVFRRSNKVYSIESSNHNRRLARDRVKQIRLFNRFDTFDSPNSRSATASQPIGISSDNSIIRARNSINASSNSLQVTKPSVPLGTVNKSAGISMEWDPTKSFYLSVEPWLVSPLISDSKDGFYLGSLKGSKITQGDTTLDLMVGSIKELPIQVVCLVKNKKAYVFRVSDLTAEFMDKAFSTIDSDDEFREYAHTVMKEAHGDNYSEEVTNKVVDDLLDSRTGDYGELIGRLTSGFGRKDDNRNYSSTDPEISYRFETILSEPVMEADAVIGTLVMSIAYSKLFHLCTTDYVIHKAMDEYTEKMDEISDEMGEIFLSLTKSARFRNCISPKSMDPIEYLERLSEYINSYKSNSGESSIKSILDKATELIRYTLYKLKRLKSGAKTFSIGDRSFTDRRITLQPNDTRKIKKSAIKTISAYVKLNKKSPLEDLSDTSQRGIERYVDDKASSPNLLAIMWEQLTGAIFDTTLATTKKMIKDYKKDDSKKKIGGKS